MLGASPEEAQKAREEMLGLRGKGFKAICGTDKLEA